MDGRGLQVGLLGLVHLQDVVDVLEGQTVVLFAAVELHAEHQRVHVVRCLPELLVHQLQCLGLVLFVVQDLVGLLEVVVVVGFLLGVDVGAQKGQQHGCQEGCDVFHMRESIVGL